MGDGEACPVGPVISGVAMDISEIRQLFGFDEWRPGQGESVESVLDYWADDSRFVGLDAPTGSGKSLSGVVLGEAANEEWGGRTAILVSSRALQDQYARDFADFTTDFRGKSNYNCPFLTSLGQDINQPRPCRDVQRKLSKTLYNTAVDRYQMWDGVDCPVKSSCDYYIQKYASQKDGSITVTNFANYLGLVNHDPRYGEADTLICDEAHKLDDIMEGYASVEVLPRHWERLRFSPHEQEEWLSERTYEEWCEVIKTWMQRSLEVNNDLQQRRDRLEPDERRTFSWLENFQRKLNLLLNLRGGFHVKIDMEKHSCLFRAYYPSELAPIYLWRTTPRILCMSATLEPQSVQWCLPENEQLQWVSVPSTFPRNLSPIDLRKHLRCASRFNRKDERDERKVIQWVEHQDSLLEKAKAANRRVLMLAPAGRHVDYLISYSKFSSYMIAHRDFVDFKKQDAIATFKERTGWCVLVGAYDLAEGYDFPGEEVETTILSKLFIDPARFDELIQQRMERDPFYVLRREAQWICQAVGRGWRSETDRNHIVVSDASGKQWLQKRLQFINQGVRDRILWGE